MMRGIRKQLRGRLTTSASSELDLTGLLDHISSEQFDEGLLASQLSIKGGKQPGGTARSIFYGYEWRYLGPFSKSLWISWPGIHLPSLFSAKQRSARTHLQRKADDAPRTSRHGRATSRRLDRCGRRGRVRGLFRVQGRRQKIGKARCLASRGLVARW